jgi:cytosine/uracil/thiamine/allantoin permease
MMDACDRAVSVLMPARRSQLLAAARFMQPQTTNTCFEWRAHMALSAMDRGEHSEGQVARAIEHQTAKLPSDTFLWAAVGAISTSMSLQLMGKQHASLFVGQWAPTLLILGLYNKIVKELGHDAQHHQMA